MKNKIGARIWEGWLIAGALRSLDIKARFTEGSNRIRDQIWIVYAAAGPREPIGATAIAMLTT